MEESVLHSAGTLFVQCGWVSKNCNDEELNTCRTTSMDHPVIQQAPTDLEPGWSIVPSTPKLSADAFLRRSISHVCFSISDTVKTMI